MGRVEWSGVWWEVGCGGVGRSGMEWGGVGWSGVGGGGGVSVVQKYMSRLLDKMHQVA